MKIQVSKLLAALLLCCGIGARAGNVVTIGSVSGAPGEEVTLSISLTNQEEVSSMQLLIPLSESLSFVEGSATLTSRCGSHSVTAGVKDGVLSLMVFSMNMDAISGNDGDVASLRLKLGNIPADIPLNASKIILTDTEGNPISDTSVSNGSVSIRCAKAQYNTMTVDFGRVPILSTYHRTVQVTNTGNEPLTVTGLQFNSYPTDFSSETSFPFTVAAGGSANIDITYAPQERGTIREEVKVLCNSISKLNNISLQAQPFAVNELHMQPASGLADDIVTVAMTMNNMDPISGFQFEFELPAQLEYVPNSFQLSDRKQDHAVLASLTGNVLRIICYSATDKPFTGEDGELATMQLKLSGRNSTTLKASKCLFTSTINNQVTNVCSADYGATITINSPRISASGSLNMGAVPVTEDARKELRVTNPGNAPLTISRVLFDKEGFEIEESLPLTIDTRGNTSLTVVYPSKEEGDFSTTMHIYSNDPEQRLWDVAVTGNRFAPNYFDIRTPDVSAFENMKVEVSVNTYDPIVGIQFDLIYPGQYYEPFSDNYTLEPRAEGMTVTYREIDSNTLRFFCYFLSDEGITAGEGKVMTIELKPKGDYVYGGVYTVGVNNVKMGTKELADKYSGMNSETTLTVIYPVTSISIEPAEASLDKGQTIKLTVSVNEEATNKNVIWGSSDEGIVRVDANGNVTGIEYGTTTITAISEDNPQVTATCEVIVVYYPVTNISISESSITLEGGERFTLTASVNDEASNKNVVWSSSNDDIATVNSEGEVLALHQGTAIITAKSADNPEVTTTCMVEVTSDIAYSGNVNIPNVPFEFLYDAACYDESSHSIPNHPLANLGDYSLRLTENIPEQRNGNLLHIDKICKGYIDKWEINSTSSGSYFYRGGQDCMTIVCKVSPQYGTGSNPGDFISNRERGYNYMFRIGDQGRFFLHTGTAYNESRSMAIQENEPQILAIRVDGNNNVIKLQNLTTDESLSVNGVNWGGSNNVFKIFYNNGSEYYLGDFYWVYYSFELLTDEQLQLFAKKSILGDANGDGNVDVSDFSAIAAKILGHPASNFVDKAADINKDGVIDVSDLSGLAYMILHPDA